MGQRRDRQVMFSIVESDMTSYEQPTEMLWVSCYLLGEIPTNCGCAVPDSLLCLSVTVAHRHCMHASLVLHDDRCGTVLIMI